MSSQRAPRIDEDKRLRVPQIIRETSAAQRPRVAVWKDMRRGVPSHTSLKPTCMPRSHSLGRRSSRSRFAPLAVGEIRSSGFRKISLSLRLSLKILQIFTKKVKNSSMFNHFLPKFVNFYNNLAVFNHAFTLECLNSLKTSHLVNKML